MQIFDYIFSIAGNFSAKIEGMNEATGKFNGKITSANGLLTKFCSYAAEISVLRDGIEATASALDGFSQSGIALDSQMHDLSAVAGVTGEKLEEIEGYARSSAKAFGTDAGVAVEGYKLLLSQLTPELAKCPEALSAMGDSIQVTSKLMGGDGVAAAEVLTTAMNQYGVSLDDPIQASKTMADMMNVMAAAGQAGSAELPAISAALSQCGMAAKAANVSFEETNAAIQVLDKAGKKGSEGGVALRNTLAILSKGRFLPKDTREELERAGIDVLALADKNRTLKERLELLKPVLNDSALFSQLFGMENANAARALVQGTDSLQSFTDAVTGTKSAEEQAAVVMDSYAEKQNRIKQHIEDLKISFFEATDGAFLWVSTISSGLIPLAQLAPLGDMFIRTLHGIGPVAKQAFAKVGSGVMSCLGKLGLLNIGTVLSGISFQGLKLAATNACRAIGVAIMNIPIVGWIAAGIAVVIATVKILWDKCKAFRVAVFTALELLKVIFGAFVKAVVSYFKNLWEAAKLAWHYIVEGATWVKDKAVGAFMSLYNGAKSILMSLWNFVVNMFNAIADKLATVFGPAVKSIKGAIMAVKSVFSEFVGWIEGKINSVLNEFIDIYNSIARALDWDEIKKRGKARADESWNADHKQQPGTTTTDTTKLQTKTGKDLLGITPDPSGNTLSFKPSATAGGSSGSAGDGGRIRNVTITIGKLIDRFEVHTTNLREGAEQTKEAITRALLSALNDVNLAQ